jgi:hypothetical protein
LGSCTITVNVGANAAASASNTISISNTAPIPAATPAPATVSFAIAQVGGTIALPQTGQTPTLPLTATVGMDGYTYIGVPWAYVTSGSTTPATRFTVGIDAEADCVTDNLTGLMWVKSPSITTYAWISGTSPNYTYPAQVAVDSYNTANYCGHNDWYLPTVNDLSSLLNDGFIGGAHKYQSEWLISQGFSNVQANAYWSSSTYASNTTGAWNVNFSSGNVGAGSKTSTTSVWPVRLAQ